MPTFRERTSTRPRPVSKGDSRGSAGPVEVHHEDPAERPDRNHAGKLQRPFLRHGYRRRAWSSCCLLSTSKAGTDSLIVLMAVPFSLCGAMWMLFVTQTHVSVPALMGTLMCIGLTTANSILVVTFCNQRVDAGVSARRAAVEAGYTRLRPVLMTAGAMILGMIPDGAGRRRRRRAKRASGARRNWRAAFCHVCHASVCSDDVPVVEARTEKGA